MIQIIGFLLCVYLVFKGFEILQIALASSREDRRALIMWGTVWFVASIAVAVLFAAWILLQGQAVQNQTNPAFPFPPSR